MSYHLVTPHAAAVVLQTRVADHVCAVVLQEREAELASLRRRAHMVTDGFNSLEDVTCNFTEGKPVDGAYDGKLVFLPA